MGLLSKLLGNNASSALKSVMDDAEKKVREIMKEAEKADTPKSSAEKPAAPAAPVQEAAEERADALWGEIMPKDENQFDFKGTYKEYFEKIFAEEFSEYSFMLSHPKYYSSDIYTFSKGGSKKLVVELMKKSCDAQALRRETQREGIPYLRFYTNCSDQGWWNARSYVTGRIREALDR